ncbi:MAG: threonylcarbamoyl-AMP synthase [Clostridiales bacterium]|nr:threonylcarbamoyl-AMP synthase [Clostridiales bacterium]
MRTKLFIIPQAEGFQEEIDQAAHIIREGGLVAIPTETVYGLGADALNEDAVRRIYEAKGRPSNNPLIIHVPSADWLAEYCRDVPEVAYRLAEQFWPGPLTMILQAKDVVPKRTTGGLDTVAVRCPSHPVALAIIQAAGVPVAAPSANTSGRPSCTTAQHVIEDMAGKIDGIVDGGDCAVGVESTIIDLTCSPPQLLRPGGMPLEDIQAVIGTVRINGAVTSEPAPGEVPRAPGMAYRHYAPKAPVTVVVGEPERSARFIQANVGRYSGVICFDEFADRYQEQVVQSLGSVEDKAEQARRVFDALRAFDSTQVQEIYAQCPDSEGLGLAVGNRLKKAAGFHVVEVR